MIQLQNLGKVFRMGRRHKTKSEECQRNLSHRQVRRAPRAKRSRKIDASAHDHGPRTRRFGDHLRRDDQLACGLCRVVPQELTETQNTRFLARVTGSIPAPWPSSSPSCGARAPFHAPFRTYSSGMRWPDLWYQHGIRFDTYLVDEVTSVGDAAFKRKSRRVFQDRMQSSSAIVVTHSMGQVRRLCDAGVVIENGRLRYYDDLDKAIAHHEENMGGGDDDDDD